MLKEQFSNKNNKRDVAIIGFSCRFPGASNAEQFWHNLKNGLKAIKKIRKERWDIDTYYSPNSKDDFKSTCQYGGFIDDVDLFDAAYFRIKEERARLMDPQQRLILEISAEAINHAGYTKQELSGSKTSVFIGAGSSDYGSSNKFLSQDNAVVSNGVLINNKFGFLGNIPNMIPAVISQYFNLTGPSVVISTACSSSLAVLHLACQSILSGESQLAIAGGIQLYFSPRLLISTSKIGCLSSDGTCRPFSKYADGYVLSEGIGICLLKPLEEAIHDGDMIYALIKSTAVNNDGKIMSMIMVNADAQERVIGQALENAGIDATTISYFEANGTAMKIGDPVEVKAASSAYQQYTNEKCYCAIGSVEANIGHAVHTAGLASVLKVVMSLLNKQIPPTLYWNEINPHIDFPNTPFYPNKELSRWQPRHNCRRAGINAFGFGGTNCHVILEGFDKEKYDNYRAKRVPLSLIKYNKKRYWIDEHTICDNTIIDKKISDERAKDDTNVFVAGAIVQADEKDVLVKIQQELVRIVADILKVSEKDIDIDEAMDEYDFDSVALVKFANQINSLYGLDISPALFFEHPTIGSFAQYMYSEYEDIFLRYYLDHGKSSGIGQKERPYKSATEESQLESLTQSLPLPDVRSHRRTQPALEQIAIIGMSGVMPQSEDMGTFWRHLEEGRDLITEIPQDRWNWPHYYGDPNTEANKTRIKWGGFMKEVDKFDANFFGISPREANLMDPQQRIFIETVWKTIEDAGYKPSDVAGTKTGLFVGVSSFDYNELIIKHALTIEAHIATGIAHSILANRISYLFDFHGPSEPVDTACSSSLIAIHRAVQAMRAGNCEMAIAGGVNVMLTPTLHISFGKAGMLSEDGRCKTFDKRANGYVRGEGAGALLLKPLGKAIADGDHIYAVIKGTAENHGGHATSLTAPNPNAQADLLLSAFEEAKIDPSTVSYIETHGTGTSLGDPIEINGLKKAFEELHKRWGKPYPKKAHCGIGAVKTNIGHLEAAAGIAGVIKVLLAMKYKKLPASIHFQEINPYIQLQGSPFYIVKELRPWECLQDEANKAIPRRAGVSSFGFGGANAHIVLEEYEKPISPSHLESHAPEVILLSAKNKERLKAYAQKMTKFLAQEHDICCADMAYTLQVGREAMEERLAVIVSDSEDLAEKLNQYCREQKDIENLYKGRVLKEKAKGEGGAKEKKEMGAN
ncbi:MAG: beta-ketoacyl synthase N-terminal-like domain-containing protein [bacterium]